MMNDDYKIQPHNIGATKKEISNTEKQAIMMQRTADMTRNYIKNRARLLNPHTR